MVARLGSFSLAAEALGLGQPAVTKHVQRLEAEIGRQLLSRDTRPFLLTAAGSNLFRMAEPLVDGLDTLVTHAPLASPPIAVAVPHGMIGYLLPETVADLRKIYPGSSVRIYSATKEEAIELVQFGRVDFAIVPEPMVSQLFDFTPLYCSERILITPRDHPFVSHAPHSLADIARYPLILPRFQTQTRALLESEFRRHGIKYDIAVEIDSTALLERYVEIGVGLAIGLRGTVLSEVRLPLGIVSLKHLMPSERVGILRNKSRPLAEHAKELIKRLEAATGRLTSAA